MDSKYRGLKWLDQVYCGAEKRELLPDWRWFLPVTFVFSVLFFVSVLSSVDRLGPPKISDWTKFIVEEPNTRVWNLAKKAASGRYDITGISALISQKNNLKGDYNLYPGQEILLPVFGENKK